MAEKLLNSRIVMKHDISSNWEKATNFIPKDGELIVYTDVKKFKVGDGATTVNNLIFYGGDESGSGEIFEVVYGTTTYEEIEEAYNDNKQLVCRMPGGALSNGYWLNSADAEAYFYYVDFRNDFCNLKWASYVNNSWSNGTDTIVRNKYLQYNNSTYQEASEAWQNGYMLYCQFGSGSSASYLPLAEHGSNNFIFTELQAGEGAQYREYILNNDGWSFLENELALANEVPWVYEAIYDEELFDDVMEAYSRGDTISCYKDDESYALSKVDLDGSKFYFHNIENGEGVFIETYILSDGGWETVSDVALATMDDIPDVLDPFAAIFNSTTFRDIRQAHTAGHPIILIVNATIEGIRHNLEIPLQNYDRMRNTFEFIYHDSFVTDKYWIDDSNNWYFIEEDSVSQFANKNDTNAQISQVRSEIPLVGNGNLTIAPSTVTNGTFNANQPNDTVITIDAVTHTELNTALDNLPKPMIFKGTLGTNGTITTLPSASTENEGFTYKVITDGTYASQAAKVGDVFTSNGTAWVLIPSGDDIEDTWRAIKVNGTQVLGSGISTGAMNLVAGDNVSITGSGNDITIAASNYNITYGTADPTGGSNGDIYIKYE